MEKLDLLLIKSIYIYILFQCSTYDIAVLNEPKLLFRIPSATGRFCLIADCHVLGVNPQWYERIVCET